MKQNSIIKVGLTGGIGCGKSTISTMLKEEGIPIIDADKISRQILISHPKILNEIRSVFGDKYFDDDGNFLRRKMGELIFSNENKRKKYEGIIMPYIVKDIFLEIKKYNNLGMELCIIDAPTLIENNLHKNMDVVIVIVIEEEIQITRVMARDEFSRDEAILRINNQMSTKEKIKVADYVIDNGGDFEYTKFQVQEILNEIRKIRGRNDWKK